MDGSQTSSGPAVGKINLASVGVTPTGASPGPVGPSGPGAICIRVCVMICYRRWPSASGWRTGRS